MNIEDLQDYIVNKLAKYNIHVSLSKRTKSVYIKVANKYTIRISDHYNTHNGRRFKYNIGPHIDKFKKYGKCYYYKSDRVNQLIIRVIKDIKDNKVRV